jgi:hypothetical protein
VRRETKRGNRRETHNTTRETEKTTRETMKTARKTQDKRETIKTQNNWEKC